MAESRQPVALNRWSLIGLAVGVVFCAGVLISLGNWQLHRLDWKLHLIDTVEKRTKLPPVAAPGPDAWGGKTLEENNYRPVRLTGRFLHKGEAHVLTSLSEPRGRFGGPGYLIFTPFETEDGWTVMVNRGFVPSPLKDRKKRPEKPEIAGEVTVEGLFRAPPPPNAYAPDPQIDKNVWYSRDVLKMAETAGLPVGRTAPYTVDLVAKETPAGGIPQAGETRMHWVNNHLQYALTWYGLALALLGVYGAFMWTNVIRPKRRQGASRA